MAGLCVEQKSADRLRTRLPRQLQAVFVISLQVALDKRRLLRYRVAARSDVFGELLNSRIDVGGKLKILGADFWRNAFLLSGFRESCSVGNLRQNLILHAPQS